MGRGRYDHISSIKEKLKKQNKTKKKQQTQIVLKKKKKVILKGFAVSMIGQANLWENGASLVSTTASYLATQTSVQSSMSSTKQSHKFQLNK